MQKYSNEDQINFFCRGQLPPVPKYLENVYKIVAKANKLGIEYCGKSMIAVQKEIEVRELTMKDNLCPNVNGIIRLKI